MRSIQDRFFNAMPIRVKRSSDWVAPALAGLAVGVAVGVGIGLLYAPSTGDAARHRLREGAARMRHKAANIAQKARHQLSAAAREQAETPLPVAVPEAA
jgi:hypothetical protein